jgi:ATP-dependent protease ClpP protease subunit
MPDFNTIVSEIKRCDSPDAVIRKKYLKQLSNITNRNTILYYSAFLQKKGDLPFGIDDTDMNGFMSVFKGLDYSKGLDLILHTPGGAISATEAIIHYIRSLFKTDIRVIVPQLAMSAGTLVALSAKEIIMGHHSSLGPIDPQFMGVSAHAVVQEFKRAKREIQHNPRCIELWKTIIAKYHPTFIGDCQKAVKWGENLAKDLLSTGMFQDDSEEYKKQIIDQIIEGLADHNVSKSHNRHFSSKQCADFGIKIFNLESDQKLQDVVLSIHHATICTVSNPPIIKLIENHEGKRHILGLQIPS